MGNGQACGPVSPSSAGTWLRDLAPEQRPWDWRRADAADVGVIYGASGEERHAKYAARIDACSRYLEFGLLEELDRLVLTYARFCRVRTCPVCQWRRAMLWKARFHEAWPAIEAEYAGHASWIFLTLTVANMPVSELRRAVLELNRAWARLRKRERWPAIGFVKSVEVTCDKERAGYAHPHIHVLAMVPASSFDRCRTLYVPHWEWVEQWRQTARLDYDPWVDVRRVRAGEVRRRGEIALRRAVAETLKYALKPADMKTNPEWFLRVSDELHRTRGIEIGGELRRFLDRRAPRNLVVDTEIEDAGAHSETCDAALFTWADDARRYRFAGVRRQLGSR